MTDKIPGITWMIPDSTKNESDYNFVVAFGATFDTVVGPYSDDN